MSKSTATGFTLGRRTFLLQVGTLAAFPTLALTGYMDDDHTAFPMQYSTEEWQRRLGHERFRVMREAVMETPLSSQLLHETRDGVYLCAGCGQALFSSRHKLHQVGAWPTFSAPVRQSAVSLAPHHSWTVLLQRRIFCSRCGGHLGMVFNDGDDGFRFAINGLALQFLPARDSKKASASMQGTPTQ